MKNYDYNSMKIEYYRFLEEKNVVKMALNRRATTSNAGKPIKPAAIRRNKVQR